MKEVALPLLILVLLGCTTTITTKKASELPPIPVDVTPQEAVSYVTATCAGFAKYGHENGHGSELAIFNDCLSKAVKILEKQNGSSEE